MGYAIRGAAEGRRTAGETLPADGLLERLAGPETRRSRAGARHLLAMPCIAELAADARLMTIAGEFLGRTPFPFRATLFDKRADANWMVVWHQDTSLPLRRRFDDAAWGPWSTKEGILYTHAPTEALARVVALRLHLDDSTGDNGPLRVLPGSHRRGVLSDEEVSWLAREGEPVECLVPKGGVLAMRPLLIHASSKSQSGRPRRVLHVEYADSLSLAPGVDLAVC